MSGLEAPSTNLQAPMKLQFSITKARIWILATWGFFGAWSLGFGASAASPLADAVEKKDLAAIRALIGDSNVNAAQVDGMTALHWAAHHDDLATAKALLAAKADANAKNRYGVTPLSLACKNGSDTMVAVRAWQKKVGMEPADGYAGLKVLARLQAGGS